MLAAGSAIAQAATLDVVVANFNSGTDSFVYADNTFQGTTQSAYAAGDRIATGGFSGGALRVSLGGVDNASISGMSGGWSRTFSLTNAADVTLSFRVNVTLSGEYESDEFTSALASLNGTPIAGANPFATVTGDGNGGPPTTTGWQLAQLPLGQLPPGTYTIVLGGFNNKKTLSDESSTVLIDEVLVRAVEVVTGPVAPVGAADSYSTQVNAPLSIPAPGVLANDTDANGDSLTAVLQSTTAQGVLSLSPNGSFTYTPPAGFSGPVTFVYRASDGALVSANTTVTITVNPPGPATIFESNFNTGTDSFVYADNTFQGTTQSAYAAGDRVATGGFSGGALRVSLGGVDNSTISNMSGGWSRSFTLSVPTTVTLSLRINVTQSPEYESDEFSTGLASVDGVLVNGGAALATVTGNGNGGSSISSGWLLRELQLGILAAGSHTVTIGGYNNKKTLVDESTTILIDDVLVTGTAQGGGGGNQPPTATPLSLSVNEDGSLNITLAGTDPNGDPLSFSLLGSPAHGNLSGTPPALIYTPAANYFGADSFPFQVSDGLATAQATVSITVNPVNDAPVAVNDSASTNENQPVVISVLSNDTDVEGQALSIASVVQGSNGTAVANANGTITFTPANGFSGSTSFGYRATDGSAQSNLATVSVSVGAVNDPPTGVSDSYSTPQNTPLSVTAPGVLANDTDPDGDPLTAVLQSTTAQGVLSLSPNGSFTYTPPTGFTGPATFVYRASDGLLQSANTTVTINVTPVGGEQIILQSGFDSGASGLVYTDDPFLGTSEPDYASGTWQATGGFSGGALQVALGGIDTHTIARMSGGWRYIFPLSTASPVTLSFRVNLTQTAHYESDEFSAAIVTVDGVAVDLNGLGELFDLFGDGNGGAPVTSGWLPFELPLGTLAAGSHTIIIGAYNNKKTLDDESTTLLIDDFKLTASSSGGGGNQPPTASPDSATTAINQPVVISVLNNDSDPEGQPLSVASIVQGANGTASANPNGSITFTPAGGFTGSASFQYRASDGLLTSNLATVTVQVSPGNLAPIGVNDSYSTFINTPLSLPAPGVLANDSDPNGDPLTAVLVSSVSQGSLLLNPNGSFTYTPPSSFTGNVSFTYRASDAQLQSAITTVTIGVTSSTGGSLLSSSFDSGSDGFSYADDVFRSTGASAYASGAWTASGGFNGGGLRVDLGGLDSAIIVGISGGWSRSFNVPSPANVRLTFRYRLTQSGEYESDEYSQILASLDGNLLGKGNKDFVDQITGSGLITTAPDTLWRQFSIQLGVLSGTHTLTLGGYNNKKSLDNEAGTVFIDDVLVETTGPPPAPTAAEQLVSSLNINRFKSNIQSIASFGDRVQSGSFSPPSPGSPGVSYDNAEAWLHQQLAQMGYTVQVHNYSFDGTTKRNTYVTKVGTVRPDQMYILGAHFDGRGGGGAADDDASGSSLLMEIARAFAQPGVSTDKSVRLIWWNTEETGLNGSRAYVAARASLRGVQSPPGSGQYPEPEWLGMIQYDMIMWDHGYPWVATQIEGADIEIEYTAGTNFAAQSKVLADQFRSGNDRFSTDYPAEVGDNMCCTDSVAFYDYAPTISVKENTGNPEQINKANPHHHEPTDNYSSYSELDFRFGFNVLQLTMGTIGELAGAHVGP